MSVERGQDQCADCGTPVPNELPGKNVADRVPCPNCGSTKRLMFVSAHATVKVSASADGRLIIGWGEVERLLTKVELAAALLVAAVNVEFILWEKLRRFAPAAGLTSASDKVKSIWGQIQAGHGEMVSLSSLISVAECFTQNDKFRLSPPSDPLARDIDTVRNCIAHERGYFASLTELKELDWPEARIRQVLESAKEFCHGNAP